MVCLLRFLLLYIVRFLITFDAALCINYFCIGSVYMLNKKEFFFKGTRVASFAGIKIIVIASICDVSILGKSPSIVHCGTSTCNDKVHYGF